MIYAIKKHLLEEGILDHVKNNIGKYALAGAGLAAAGAGEFGSAAEGLTNSAAHAGSEGLHHLADMGHRTIDHYAGAPESHTAHTTAPQHDAATHPDPSKETYAEHMKREAEAKQQADIQAKLNDPRVGHEHHTFHDTDVSVDKDGHTSYDRHINDTGKDTLYGLGAGVAGLGLLGAHKRDKRRMQDSYNAGVVSVKR